MMNTSTELNKVFTSVFKNRKTREQAKALATYTVREYAAIRSADFNSLLVAFKTGLDVIISVAHVLSSTDRHVYYFLGYPNEIIEKLKSIEKPKLKKTLLQQAKIAFTKYTKLKEQKHTERVLFHSNRAAFLTGGKYKITDNTTTNNEVINFMFDNIEKCYPPKSLIIKTLTSQIQILMEQCKEGDGPSLQLLMDKEISIHKGECGLRNDFWWTRKVVNKYEAYINNQFVTDDLIKEAYNNVCVGKIMKG